MQILIYFPTFSPTRRRSETLLSDSETTRADSDTFEFADLVRVGAVNIRVAPTFSESEEKSDNKLIIANYGFHALYDAVSGVWRIILKPLHTAYRILGFP